MTDIFNKEQRSFVMSKVKSSKNSSTELRLISVFKEFSLKGWRRNYKIFGKPDFVFISLKIAVFADGCFWHGHKCRNTTPQDNRDYWETKIARNQKRDADVTKYLEQKGWKVIRIWECEMQKKNREKLFPKLRPLTNARTEPEEYPERRRA